MAWAVFAVIVLAALLVVLLVVRARIRSRSRALREGWLSSDDVAARVAKYNRTAVSPPIQPHIFPGEHVLWSGGPDPHRLLSRNDATLIPFSLLWGGFATLLWAGVLASSSALSWPSVLGVLWVLPFFLIGQYLIWGRFITKRWDRMRTAYAVTDQRILIVRTRSVQALFLSTLPGVDRSVRNDGSGSIWFGSGPAAAAAAYWADTGMDFMSGQRPVLAFYDIPEVERVYSLIGRVRLGG